MMSKSTVPGEFQGQLQGTIAFMAPEVSDLCSKTDFFSFSLSHIPSVLPCADRALSRFCEGTTMDGAATSGVLAVSS